MLKVEESKDYPLLKTIFTHADIWWRIAGDEDPEALEIPPEMIYLLATVDDKPAGIFVLHEAVSGTDSHVQILPEFRRYKYRMGAAFLRKAAEFTDRITTDIPKNHPNVHQYALRNGYNVLREDDESWYYEKELKSGFH